MGAAREGSAALGLLGNGSGLRRIRHYRSRGFVPGDDVLCRERQGTSHRSQIPARERLEPPAQHPEHPHCQGSRDASEFPLLESSCCCFCSSRALFFTGLKNAHSCQITADGDAVRVTERVWMGHRFRISVRLHLLGLCPGHLALGSFPLCVLGLGRAKSRNACLWDQCLNS